MPSNPSLTLGGKIVAAAGALFLITSFLPYFRFCSTVLGNSTCANADAWDFALTKTASLLVILLLAEVVLVQVAKVKLPQEVTGFLGLGRLALAGLAALLVLAKLVVGQSVPEIEMPDFSGFGIDTSDIDYDMGFSRSIGLFLGLLFAIALVVGNVLRLNETPATQPQVPSGPPSGQWQQNQQFGQPGQPGQQFGQAGQPQWGHPAQPDQNQYPQDEPTRYVQPGPDGQFPQQPGNNGY
ncbi:hypothetical protein [Kineosporia sp. NBRC 101731]|uniref:hypothetical protein n=1 Tax=Kineosporia sp. NBRC 101731 TaxID=3032199 RepID=UPI0024A412E1|nr:hypothetical protein [Kineosporia sp. NBRC 101731]GLY28352.1 hypothetical protein Kisp02_17170 [Kineosporia sp. NBRC 101731]